MSHAATNWAIQQRGLKPATKIVLWHLCDRHNPDFGCFPSQARLAEDAEMSVSALNAHLARLEAAGLIRRLRCHDPRTHRRQTTRYILAFEPGFEPAPPHEPDEDDDGSDGDGDGDDRGHDDCDAEHGTDAELPRDPSPDSGHGSISGFSGEPSPDSAQSHLRNPETNLVREPLSKPVKEEEGAQAREAISDDFFEKLLRALGLDPAGPLPGWWQGPAARTHVRRWRDDLGLSPAAILTTAEDSRHEHPTPPDGPKALDRAMQRAAGREAQRRALSAGPGTAARHDGHGRGGARPFTGPMPSLDAQAAFYADLVNSARFLPPSMISNAMRDAMLERGLVTVERLRARGVR